MLRGLGDVPLQQADERLSELQEAAVPCLRLCFSSSCTRLRLCRLALASCLRPGHAARSGIHRIQCHLTLLTDYRLKLDQVRHCSLQGGAQP